MVLKEQDMGSGKFIPGDINSMIRHLILLNKSQLIISRIGTVRVHQTSLENDLNLFQRIFSLRHSVTDVPSQNTQLEGHVVYKEDDTSKYRKVIRRKIDLATKSES
mmetsp:Transcript_33891/g.59082  ORF Transcript_33891/g.59082 Transcript_33891/m.59082 type:complete len:106 (-) Transcript_33891:1753-2070(-)